MSSQAGRNLALSPFRCLVTDLMHFCQKVPAVTVDRTMDLSALAAARRLCVPRPSLTAIFLKAMSFVTAEQSVFRRAYMSFPWPHLYEHPINIANFTIERRYHDEDIVFFAQVRSPERRSLADIEKIIRRCKDQPVESIAFFRRAIRMSKIPWPLRRFVWWASLNLFGKLRSHNYGTSSLSSVAGEGAGIMGMMTLLTSTLHYGLFDNRNCLSMRLTFDHRVLDGACVARALVRLEEVLHHEILAELCAQQAIKAA